MMSKDRIKFVVPDKMRRSEESNWMTLLAKSFGMTETFGKDMYITCRPSQFARFLIYRDEMGMKNDFKGLSPKIISYPACNEGIEIDVSKNRHERYMS